MPIEHAENFDAVRRRYPLIIQRSRSLLAVAEPASSSELSYCDLLSEARYPRP